MQHGAVGQTPDTSGTAAFGRHYERALSTAQGLRNGPEYVDYVRSNTVGHRYFNTPDEQLATLTYAGVTYADVPLRYDLVRERLVFKPYRDDLQIQLVDELVEQFSIGGHTFIRLGPDAPDRTRFYDVLVAGPVQLLAARRKKYAERTLAATIEGEITAKTTYYLHKNGRYYPIKKAQDIAHLFPENRAALRSHLAALEKAEPEQALVALVRYQTGLGTPAR